jgi:hypothetical protein
MAMLEELRQRVAEVGALHSKLILLVGGERARRTEALAALAVVVGLAPLNIGLALGRALSVVPQKQRHLQTGVLLRDLVEQHALGDLLLVSHTELLFDRSLQQDPIDLLKRIAHVRTVVAVWPGEWQVDRLSYAPLGHPEHREYGLEGLVPFEIR